MPNDGTDIEISSDHMKVLFHARDVSVGHIRPVQIY